MFEFDISKVKYINATTKNDAHYWLKNDDFLMTRINTSKLVGHVAICDGMEELKICCDLIMKMRIDEDKVRRRLVYWHFRTPQIRELITSSARGTNPTMRKINKSIIQDLPVFLLSIPEQEIVLKKLNDVYRETQRLESIYQRKLEALQELKQSILHKAFTGEVTVNTTTTEEIAA
ncbi:hypothetical protein [Coleofasciculus sp. E2-BRE-01]|uniref:hypothetical protein n=1 Tax=Coleofasciculus sp. E2-BRE-01 TaxID=3069524 RepID=UPI0032F2F27D